MAVPELGPRAAQPSNFSWNPLTLIQTAVTAVAVRVFGESPPSEPPPLIDRVQVYNRLAFPDDGDVKDFSGWDPSASWGTDVICYQSVSDVGGLFDGTSRPYPMTFIEVDGKEIEVAKTFLTDIERSGEPDQFFINEEEISPPPKTDAQKQDLLRKMLQIAGGDAEKVTRWTEIWNYRVKIDLQNSVMEEFQRQFKLSPVFGRNGLSNVKISLNTETEKLECIVEGVIENAMDDDLALEMPEIREVNYSFSAIFVFEHSDRVIEKAVRFKNLAI